MRTAFRQLCKTALKKGEPGYICIVVFFFFFSHQGKRHVIEHPKITANHKEQLFQANDFCFSMQGKMYELRVIENFPQLCNLIIQGPEYPKHRVFPISLYPKFLLGCTAMSHGLIPVELKWQTTFSSFQHHHLISHMTEAFQFYSSAALHQFQNVIESQGPASYIASALSQLSQICLLSVIVTSKFQVRS